MHSAWFRGTFLKLLEFTHIKNGGLNLWGAPILQKGWIICSPVCILNLKVLWTKIPRHSLDFKHSAYFRSTFIRVFQFLQIKQGARNFWGEPILQKVWIIWFPLLHINFKRFVDPISSSFNRFQCFLHNSGVLFSEFWNFYKLKRGDLISGRKQFCRKSELFGLPFPVSVIKIFCAEILRHSLDFNPFCIIH